MLSKKDVKSAVFVISCILLNLLGKTFANYFHLPLWLDSFGTVIAAYKLGGLSGAIIGVTMNILYSANNPVSYIYSITSIGIALIVGTFAKKRYFETVFGTMCVAFLVTIVAVFVSVIMSWTFSDGMTNNIWGDGVIRYFEEQGVPIFLSSVAGQFYIDFMDKTITLMSLYFLIKIWRRRKQKGSASDSKSEQGESSKIRAVPLFLFVAVLFSANQNLEAQIFGTQDFNSYVQTIYSSDSGLPCGEANDIVQTPDGILWIGTYAGLYRYNGSEFKWMNEFESVRSVNCLYVDEEGRLWIGTNDNGLSICINEKIVNTLDSSDGLTSNSVRAIVKGADGYYYVGTTTGVSVLELNSGLRICNIISDVGYTAELSADQNGFVSAVSASGELFIMSESEIRFSQKLDRDKELFNSCQFDKNGILYTGTSKNHVYRFEISDESATMIDSLSCKNLSNLNTIFFDGERGFVCADNGIGYFDQNLDFHVISTGNFNNSVDNMTLDYQGNYWFTSSRQGVLRLSASSFSNLYGSLGISSRVVNTIVEWQGILYIGTDKGLDAIQNGARIANSITNQFAGTRIRCLKKDSKNRLWVCTYGNGLVCIEPNGKSKTYDSSMGTGNRTRVCVELSDGTVISSSDGGIIYIKDEKITQKITRDDGLTNSMILSLMEMNDGTILAGSNGDGIALIRGGKVEKILTTKDGLTSGVILRTVRDPLSEGVFIVTSNSLCYLDTAFNIAPLRNFPYFNNYDIQPNANGSLFVLGSAGIYVVGRDSLLSGTSFLQYDLLDAKSGLTSALTANAWNYCDEEGNLYLSCGTGVYIVNMNNYMPGRRSYRMMVSSVRLDSVPFLIERSEPLAISRNVSKIEFFPEVVNYTVFDPFVSYWLEGFDPREIVIPQSELTSVTYTNLPSGTYKFHLAVLDKEQNVIERSTYEIIKEKDINDTRYFRIYMFLVAAIAIAWVTWFFVRNQLQRRIDIQKKELEFAKEQVRMGNETILAIAKTVDAKDENTSQHSMRVSEYSVMIAKELGWAEEECENLRKAALLHDIGKIGIPDRILNKPARLDDDEYAIMKTHVVRGAEILKDFTMIDHVSDGARYHHERWDGSGYAEGLKGEDIPIYARIIGMADAFDAMTANRVYRKQLDFDYVLSEIKRCRGSQFDPKIADIMLGLIENKKINVEELYKKSKGEAQ